MILTHTVFLFKIRMRMESWEEILEQQATGSKWGLFQGGVLVSSLEALCFALVASHTTHLPIVEASPLREARMLGQLLT